MVLFFLKKKKQLFSKTCFCFRLETETEASFGKEKSFTLKSFQTPTELFYTFELKEVSYK